MSSAYACVAVALITIAVTKGRDKDSVDVKQNDWLQVQISVNRINGAGDMVFVTQSTSLSIIDILGGEVGPQGPQGPQGAGPQGPQGDAGP